MELQYLLNSATKLASEGKCTAQDHVMQSPQGPHHTTKTPKNRGFSSFQGSEIALQGAMYVWLTTL